MKESTIAPRPAGELLPHVDRRGGVRDQRGLVDAQQTVKGRQIGRCDQRRVPFGHHAGIDPDDIGPEPREGAGDRKRRHRRRDTPAVNDDPLYRIRHGAGAGQ